MDKTETERYTSVSLTPDELKALYTELQSEYARYQLGSRQYVHMLRSMGAVDENGNLWALGTQSGTWYRQIGKKWVKSEPKERLFLVRRVGTVWICHHCKTNNTMDKRFCIQCGTERQTTKIGQPGEKTEPTSNTGECLICGYPLKAGVKFCTHCGQMVEINKEAGKND